MIFNWTSVRDSVKAVADPGYDWTSALVEVCSLPPDLHGDGVVHGQADGVLMLLAYNKGDVVLGRLHLGHANWIFSNLIYSILSTPTD